MNSIEGALKEVHKLEKLGVIKSEGRGRSVMYVLREVGD
jgi:predicted transcriptional regulator